MKERPIVVAKPIQPIVVLDRIRLAVSVKWIQRETMEADGADKTGWHLIGDRHHKDKRPTLFSLSDADESDFRDGVGAEDESAERRMAEGLRA